MPNTQRRGFSRAQVIAMLMCEALLSGEAATPPSDLSSTRDSSGAVWVDREAAD